LQSAATWTAQIPAVFAATAIGSSPSILPLAEFISAMRGLKRRKRAIKRIDTALIGR
jgi:hypothetical protein